MTSKVLVIQNEAIDPITLVGEWLDEVGIKMEVIKVNEGGSIPLEIPSDISGLIVLGGTMSANDDAKFSWLGDERKLISDAVETDTPMVGICLGGQMLATAVGGRVDRAPIGEIGLHSFTVSQDAQSDPVLKSIAGKTVFATQWHQDYVSDLPEDAVVLAGNDVCPVQIFRIGTKVYGFQFHPEVDDALFDSWADGADDDEAFKNQGDRLAKSAAQSAAEIRAAQAELIATWKPVIQAWADVVKAESA